MAFVMTRALIHRSTAQSAFASLFAAAIALAGCGGDDPPPANGGDDADGPRPDPVVLEDAPCEIVLATPEYLAPDHVPVGTPLEYNSNPPSSGAHYGTWAAFKEYTAPIDRGYYVHNLEHGAIVLLYKCEDASGCPDVVQALRDAAAALPADPLCETSTRGQVRARVVIAPDPLLDVPVAAAAWGFTYRARCVHPASLQKFAREHYGQGPESICVDGQDVTPLTE